MSLSSNRAISFSNINQSIQITGGNMGVNTTAPAYRLDINGDARAKSFIVNSNGTYTAGSIYRDSNWGMLVRSGTNNPSFSHFTVADFNDNKLLCISSTNGNVGIGTITPSYRFDVSGSFRATSGDITLGSALITNANITTLSVGSLALSNINISIGTIGTLISSNANITTLSVGSLALITNTNVTTETVGTSRITSNLLALGNSNTVGNIFTTGGNVGIGTGSPSVRLHVASGDIGLAYGQSIRISPEAASGWPSGTTKLIEAGWALNGMGGDVVSIYTPGSVSNAARINISSNGTINLNANVGIGIASPVANLQVNDGGFQLGPSNSNAAHLESVSGQIRFWSGSWGAGTFMAALNTTGLGLGTSAPGDELHLYTASANTNIGEIIQNGSRQYRIGIRGDSSNVFAIQDDTAGEIRMVINTAGNLGIGTGTPTFTLDVSGSARMGGNGFFRFTSDADPYAHFGGSTLSGDARLNVQHRNGALISYYYNTTKIASMSLVNNNALYINMGSNGGNQQIALADTGFWGFWGLGAANNSMQYMVGAGGSGAHVFYTNSTTGQSNAALGTERMRIAADGRVTIGGGLQTGTITTGNVYVNGGLHIDSNRSAGAQGLHLQWNRSGGGGESWIINQAGLGGAPGICFGGSDTNNNVTEWMRINNNGRVGIGTGSPRYPLHVVGGSSNVGDSNTQDTGIGYSMPYYTFYINGPGVAGGYYYEGTFSARFEDRVIVKELWGTSDQRIKKNITDIDDPTSLTILRQLKPKTYEMIDQVTTPGKIYGFIAQDVKDVLPDAVSNSVGFLPNIYDTGSITLTENGCMITLSKSSTLCLTTDNIVNNILKVRIISETKNNIEVIVKEILDEHTFIVETSNDITFTENETVFVYGQEVNDYKTVQKDVIYAVTTAAVQEIDKQLQTTKTELEQAKETINTQQAMILAMYSEIESLKNRFDNANL